MSEQSPASNPAGPFGAAIVGNVSLRSGLSMLWGRSSEVIPVVCEAGADVAIFAFLVEGCDYQPYYGEPRKTAQALAASGRMLFFATEHLPPCLVSAAAVFLVVLAASRIALDDLFASDRARMPSCTRLAAAQGGPGFIELEITPAARFGVESIRCCPFGGACRDLALTARGLDLLAEFISALDRVPGRIAPRHLPLDGTLAQVRAAAAQLKAALDCPPSIAELAAAVGLSESTLKRGFRQLYRTTPFGHLRSLRMERAKELLITGKNTVIEAAAYVGYSNPSNFAAAFRKQFGVNPKTFQMAAHR